MFVRSICNANCIALWVIWALILQPIAARAAEAELAEERLDIERIDIEKPAIERPSPLTVEPIGSVLEGQTAEEVPEEILRTEIITGARSPFTGEPLTAVEYAQLQAELASPAGGNLVNDDIQYLVFLLQLRQAVRPIIPFLP
ncbi:MAG: hypothetical protein AAF703_13285 [Cyanobacteria bacterium P01_D01_bin.105]